MTVDQLVRETELLTMKYCFLCDEAGPHHVEVIGTELVFQCGECFALHVDSIGTPAVRHAVPGRHRA